MSRGTQNEDRLTSRSRQSKDGWADRPLVKPCSVSIIVAPTDIGASVRGASMGPEALRVAGVTGALARCADDVSDRGNLSGP